MIRAVPSDASLPADPRLPTELAAIERRPGLGRTLVFLIPTVTALFAMFNGIQSVMLPGQIAAFDPVHKVGNLALMTTFAAIASMIGNPLGGSLSDRRWSRFGRRTPWIVALSMLSGVLMIAMGLSQNLVTLGITFTVLWLVNNMYQGVLLAILPDRVPVDRRGLASALIGLGTPLGVLVGVNVASHVGQLWGYSILAILLVATALAFVFGAREGSSTDPADVQQIEVKRRNPAHFLDAFRTRDFTIAFISRLMLNLAYFTVSGYLFYTLSDFIGAKNIPGGNVAVAVSTLFSITVTTWVVIATLFGWLADKLNRRKLFVGISALGLAATFFIPVISPTWNGMMVYAVFLGAFIGTYFAVDLAVISLVLPDEERAGRDLGILQIATALPQIVSGALAGLIITLVGYAALYLFGTIAALIAGVTIFFVRKVR